MSDEYDRYKRAQAARWLEHVRKLGARCRALQAEIESQRELASGLRGMDYSAPAVSSSPSADAVPNAVVKLQSMISDYCTELSGYIDEQRRAHVTIGMMDNAEQAEALKRHYLMGQRWEECCVAMGYSWDGMKTLRYRGLLSVYPLMPLEWRDPAHQAM